MVDVGWGNGRASGESFTFGSSHGPQLAGSLFRPSFSAASGAGRHGVVLAHGYPGTSPRAAAPSYGYPQLAARLAAETGAVVLTFDFRGTGSSEGEISIPGWRDDLVAAVQALRAATTVERLWLVGFEAGGALSVCVAAEDRSIAGVAAFAAPASLEEHGSGRRPAAPARGAGTKAPPAEGGARVRRSKELDPVALAAALPPRPLLIVHGAADEVVPMTDARALADAAHESAELRILAGAGHRVFHDPRAVALLLGWFDRHLGPAP